MNHSQALIQLAPEWLLLVGATVCLIVGVRDGTRRGATLSAIALATVFAALLVTGLLGTPSDGHILPGLWITPLVYYTRWVALGVGLLIVLLNWDQPVAEEHGEYMALILFSLAGVLLTSAANDLIVLFFAIELVSVPTYVLVALSRLDGRASEASVKYFFLGSMSAAVFAYGLALLYGAAGTTTIHAVSPGGAALATVLSAGPMTPLATAGMMLVFAGLCFKVAAVPLHVYVADVYEGAASPVTGLLGFVPKMAGFLGLIQLLAAVHWQMPTPMYFALWAVAAATMSVGNVLALLQKNVKRILAYSSIAHTGYILIALLVGPSAAAGPLGDGSAALLFYIAVYGVMNLGVFAGLTAVGPAEREVETIEEIAGLNSRLPWLALGMAVCLFSLMGLPPMAGFVGKLYIFGAAFSVGPAHPFQTSLIVLALIGVANTAVGAAYYLRVIAAMYVLPAGQQGSPAPRVSAHGALWMCCIPLVVVFAWPGALAGPARNATIVLRETTARSRAVAATGGTAAGAVSASLESKQGR